MLFYLFRDVSSSLREQPGSSLSLWQDTRETSSDGEFGWVSNHWLMQPHTSYYLYSIRRYTDLTTHPSSILFSPQHYRAAHLIDNNSGVLRSAQWEQKSHVEQKVSLSLPEVYWFESAHLPKVVALYSPMHLPLLALFLNLQGKSWLDFDFQYEYKPRNRGLSILSVFRIWSERCQKSYHRDNWLVAAKRS